MSLVARDAPPFGGIASGAAAREPLHEMNTVQLAAGICLNWMQQTFASLDNYALHGSERRSLVGEPCFN